MLMIALIMLVIISMLSVSSLRNAGSTEMVLSNVRAQELATQSAEVALRHCESSVVNTMTLVSGRAATYATTFALANILPVSLPVPNWKNMATWDSVTNKVFVLPINLVNETGMATQTYKRPPECMVEPTVELLTNLPVMPSASSKTPIRYDGTALSTVTAFIVTARGFGPEVAAADGSRSAPRGTEVWLQSYIKLNTITKVIDGAS